jgi:acylglycerol lipase
MEKIMVEYTNEIGILLGEDNVRIYYQKWLVNEPNGVVVISHGLGEHSDRYSNIIDALRGRGISFYALDHRGHGRSGSKRGHVDQYIKYIKDLRKLVKIARRENGSTPIFLLGHSMGGLIAAKYGITYPEDIDRLILSAPALIPAVKVPMVKKIMGRLVSKIIPKLSLDNEIDANDISQNKAVVQDYIDDPLNHSLVSARWFTEFEKTAEECLARGGEFSMPLLIIHGSFDKMVKPEGSIELFDKATSKDKDLKIFEGLYHETMNEVLTERRKVMSYLSDWILSRVKSKLVKNVEKSKKIVKKSPVKKAVKKKSTAKKVKKAVAKKVVTKKKVKTSIKKKSTVKKTKKK